jgi:hypothetical protein
MRLLWEFFLHVDGDGDVLNDTTHTTAAWSAR